MVKWIGHALYHPGVQRLLWARYMPRAAGWSAWSSQEPAYPYASLRGEMIHALPWGTPHLPLEWVKLLNYAPMDAFRVLPDEGVGFVSAVNGAFLRGQTIPTQGTVDVALVVKGQPVGVELKTGRWRYGRTWEPQLTRHLRIYSHVVLVSITPEAAQGTLPAMVVCVR